MMFKINLNLYDLTMFGRKKTKQDVMGEIIPSPKPTKWAFYYILLYGALPLSGFLLALDIIFYFIFKYGLERCYGILCYFE